MTKHRLNSKRKSCYSAVAAILASTIVLPGLSKAEDQSDDAVTRDRNPAEVLEEVMVTGSRIMRDGGSFPTPVTVISDEELNSFAPTSLILGLAQLPQFSGSQTIASGRSLVPNLGSHGDFLNLKGVGAERTLILQDGRRLAPTTFTGLVDTAIIPQLLVSRVDVVTAGASAAYGSDAVAGAVNFVLDRKFEGFKGVAQGALSSEGDNESYRLAMAYGTPIGEKLHLVTSLERYYTRGLPFSNRPKYDIQGRGVGSTPGAGTPGSVTNPLIDGSNLGFSVLGTPGGLITSGPYSNQTFVQSGVWRPLDPGNPTGSSGFFEGGDYSSFSGLYQGLPSTTNTGFLRLNFDASDSLTAFIQVNGTDSEFSYGQGRSVLLFGKPYFSDNAFLPDTMAAELANAGVDSFTMQQHFDAQPAKNDGTEQETSYYNIATGLEGLLGGFNWDVSYQHSKAKVNGSSADVRTDRFAAATDAVLDASGNIVCRPTLSSDPDVRARYAECSPLNMFGLGGASNEALDYVTGYAQFEAVTEFDEIEGTLSGDLFDLPAGAISFAVGAGYRESTLDLTSNGDPRFPIDTTGLRNLAEGSLPFAVLNLSTANGSVEVKELFGEVVLPILDESSIAGMLELNGAARQTDYSTSGNVTTWKVGGMWEPVDGLRFRATRSRDIRAPNLYDQFNNGTELQSVFSDPLLDESYVVDRVVQGNKNLEPESSDSYTAGVVFEPNAVPGLMFSIDYYDISVEDAIQSPGINTIARVCEESNGASSFCDLVIRNPDDNRATRIIDSPINIAELQTSGVDIEVGYAKNIGPGVFSSRLFATYVDKFELQDTPFGTPTNFAGWTEGDLSSAGAVVPRVRANLLVNYSTDRWTLSAQERMVGRLKRGPINEWAEDDLPAVFYTDLTVAFRPVIGDDELEVFLTVNNLFDKNPPKVATGPSPGLHLSTITEVYDVVGRQVVGGVRFNF